MGDASEAVALHAGSDGGATATRGWVSGKSTAGSSASASSGIGTASSGGSCSLFSSASSVDDGDDGATSSSLPADRHFSSSFSSSLSSLSSTSSESEALQMNGAAAGPLYKMLTMLDQLPAASLRTGLSRCYRGRSQSFTSLADVTCVEDLVKKTTPYIRRPKASRRHIAALGVKNRLSKTVAKKGPRGRKPVA